MPWAVFSSSLLMIFVMVATLAYIYFVGEAFTGTVRAATAATRAGVGDGEGAVQNFLLAIKNDPTNDQYYRALASAELLRVQKIVSEINAGNTSLQQTFQTTVSDAINAGKRAIEINSKDPNNWAALGLVYQSIVPFIQGAENLSISSYEEAAKLDPLNPSYPFSEANTHLALADRVAAFIGRTTDEAAKNALSKQRSDAIEAARQMLEKSISLKSDLAESNYLLAQVLIQQGNLTRAIAQVEAVKRLAPTDIGVAFQLGVLYYQSSDLAKAEAELTRATGLSENYSNARYFLGLVYDREGHHEQAISEFERIQALNPDNQEVKTILANLRAGKPALATITPPPTQRRTPPVSDAAKTGSKK
jgi:tetratricopeptide (TPR) repeat protein